MKTLKFIYLVLKMIFMTVLFFNIGPGIAIGIAYLRGKLVNPMDWQTHYGIGFSVMVVILVVYGIYEITRIDKLPE
jgi:hypothetical protein